MTDEVVAQKSFLGVPVSGDIDAGYTRKDQLSIEDLAPLFQTVLDDPLIKEFGWQQYTPYFNDGDPCVFSTNEVWFRTIHDSGTGSYTDDWQDLTISYGTHPTLGVFRTEWNSSLAQYTELGYVGDHEDLLRACEALSTAITSGSYYHVLQDAFGDLASITVRRDGIEVDSYDPE